jgi:hypothetical protein
MARTIKKFSAGGAQGRYDRIMKDIEKDRKIALAKGKNADVVEAKAAQRIADAKDDLAKRTGADRTATRKAEYEAEQRLSRTRKFGADKPVTAAEPAKAAAPAATPAAETAKAKPKSFGETFKAERARLGAGKTFTYNGKSYTTNIAGEGGKASGSRTNKGAGTPPASAGKGAGTPPASAGKGAGTPPRSGMSMKELEAQQKADNAKNPPATTTKNPPATTTKNPPATKPEPKETPAQAAARVAKLTGSAKRRENFANIFGVGSVSNARANERLAATRAKEKARNAERAKGNTPLISGTDTKAFFQYGDAAAKSNAALRNGKSKGGKVMKKMSNGGSTPPKPTAAERKADAKFRESLKKEKVTPENAAAIGRGNRSEKRYAAGGVTKEMPTSKQMGSMNMAKGGKAKMKPAAKGKAKGNPFAATKFGAAMMKKSADTKGRAMPKFAKGGSIDGCAVKGKTKASMVKMARGGKTC